MLNGGVQFILPKAKRIFEILPAFERRFDLKAMSYWGHILHLADEQKLKIIFIGVQ
jgi:hypothetical protein